MSRRALWAWSKQAVRAFVQAARRGPGGQTFHIPSGLDAALLEDLDRLTPALVQFWVNMLTGPEVKPRHLEIACRPGTWSLDERGWARFQVTLTRAFLVSILALPGSDGEEPGDETPAPPEVPTAPPEGSAEEPIPCTTTPAPTTPFGASSAPGASPTEG